jgi:hypothetical protein
MVTTQEYENCLITFAKEYYVDIKDLKKQFPYTDFVNENTTIMEDNISECLNEMVIQNEQEQLEYECSKKDEPLHDWERYFINNGTMEGY